MKNTLSGNEGRGFMKILVAAETDTVVGVHLIGPETAEIIQVRCQPGNSPHARVPCPTSLEMGAAPASCRMQSDAVILCEICGTDQAGICLHESLTAPISLWRFAAAEVRQTTPWQLSLLAAHGFAQRWP